MRQSRHAGVGATHFAQDVLIEDRFESPDSAVFVGHSGFMRYRVYTSQADALRAVGVRR